MNTPDTVHGMSGSVIVTESSRELDWFLGGKIPLGIRLLKQLPDQNGPAARG